MFHKFVDPTYVTRRFDANGNLIKEYPMISNYWFPSLPVFPQDPGESGVKDIEIDSSATVGDLYSVGGMPLARSVEYGNWPAVARGVYLWKSDSDVRKVLIQ